MPCRQKHKHKARHRTHAVKPASHLNLTPIPGTFRALPPLAEAVVEAPVAVVAPAPKKARAPKVAVAA